MVQVQAGLVPAFSIALPENFESFLRAVQVGAERPALTADNPTLRNAMPELEPRCPPSPRPQPPTQPQGSAS
eukprot:3594364-Prymnesium_polylepis.1